MSVPSAVREAAIAAFDARRADARVLDLMHDSFLDEPAPQTRNGGVRRLLVFGSGDPAEVRVEVSYSALLTELSVTVEPAEAVEVEVLTMQPQLRLVVRGTPPLRLVSTSKGPASLAITRQLPEGTQRWQTAWVTL